ncbi:TauD/TfdA family dioxygenase [Geminicoccaceae bacterium 1502E]|nr:TauD/TfdA family dioxygenase [Geminicoccaceae bacterium 1502E]
MATGFTPHEQLPDRYGGKRSSVRFEKLAEHLGAQVSEIDLSQPVSEAAWADIHDAWVVHGVLIFRSQDLPPAMHVDFSERFGELVRHPVNRFGLAGYPEITVLSNVVGADGKKIGADRAGMIWHSDMSFFEKPSMGSLLYGVECPPEGADTEFTSTYAAYAALPEEEKKRLAGLEGVHDYAWHYATYLSHRPPLTEEEKAKAPPVRHPALRTHPVTGWHTTYLSEGLTAGIAGMDPEEGRRLVIEISQFAAQPAFVYRHKWHPGDLVFWDNRSTMHRATEFDDRHRRVMRRTTVRGDRPFYAGRNREEPAAVA